MQKAYDSVEWVFLEQVLNCLNLPEIFVQWIMKCVSTVSYSVLINGKPAKHFPAKKGLRQGDPLSPFLFILAMEYLTNRDKSSIYFGGVILEIQQEILGMLGYTKGDLPFKYLGVPLSSKRMSIIQYQPLLEKMRGRITS
ncbi:secreted RxLR effector protein 78-like [Nicotiana tabacum]|uniref:Secreted RxLR effector protein 78-like n=1 Tax=Nicotiana tabacum TaxID=4097 RepID=A0AC58T459_TOBAC